MRHAEQLDSDRLSVAQDAGASLATSPEFWRDYYEHVQSEGKPWLDCSNERTHLQTIALALEAAGQVVGRRTLEIGCGRGHLSRCLSVLESSECVAVDQVASLLDGYSERFPEVDWRCGDAADRRTFEAIGTFDLIFLLEVLQYLPIAETLQMVSERLTPGGRLVAIVPNADCPIVKRVAPRFDGYYVPGDIGEIKRTLESTQAVDWWACRGLTFADDQRVAPYVASGWTDNPDWPIPPNRLLFVAQAKSAD